jgi:hypothetical protein
LLRQRNRNKESQIIKYLCNTGIRIENTYKMLSFESLPREEGIGLTNRLSSKSKLVRREVANLLWYATCDIVVRQ